MADFQLTKNQALAVETRDKTLLVSAAAGAGKTAVLIRRITSRLLENKAPLSILDMLIVTFTKAAANEVKTRLKKQLKEAAEKTANPSLRKEIENIERARISTIHAFCQSVIKDNFQNLDISPKTRIGDETTLKMLETDCVERTVETFYKKDSFSPSAMSAFRETVEIFSGSKSDVGLCEAILSYYAALRVYPYPFEFAASQIEALEKDIQTLWEDDNAFFSTTAGKIIRSEIVSVISDCLNTIDLLADECLADDILCDKYYPAIVDDKIYLHSLIDELNSEECSMLHFSDLINQYEPTAFSPVRNFHNPFLLDSIKSLRNEIKAAISDIKKKFDFPFGSDVIKEMERALSVQKMLLEMTRHFDTLLWEEKKKAGILDFADLEHLALKALVKEGSFDYQTYTFEKTPYADQLTEELKEIYVDEYQDTNLLQDTILRAVSKENNRFMVGDPKQSIYAFRGAMPALFRSYQKQFPSAEEIGGNAGKIFLSENFRSKSAILDFTNTVCNVIMNTDPSDPMYTADDALVCGRKTETAQNVTFALFDRRQTDANDDTSADENTYIAQSIAALLSSGEYSPEDIAVLARNKSTLKRIDEALKAHGIPTSAQLETPFFKQIEIINILSLLQAIDNPFRDIYLLAAMDSPMFGFSPDELIAIRENHLKEKCYRSVLRMSKEKTALGNKCADFVLLLNKLRDRARILPSDALVWELYTRFHFFSLFPAPESQSRLRTFHTLARHAESTAFHGLHHFLHLIKRRMAENENTETEQSKSSENTVKLMTVHTSKGLEFPVVFFAGLASSYNTSDQNNKSVFTQELGCTFMLPSESGYSRINTCLRKAAQIILRNRFNREEMRILYVALTRARDRLFLTGSPISLPATLRRTLPDAAMTGHMDISRRIELSKCHLDLILLALSNDRNFSKWALFYNPEYSNASYQFSTHPLTVMIQPTVTHTVFNAEKTQSAQLTATLTKEVLTRALEYSYPYQEDTHLPQKISVSQIKSGKITVDEMRMPSPQRTPDFIRAEQSDGASHGTAMHLFMQYCNFSHCTALGVREEAQDLVAKGFLSASDAEKLNFFALTKFFTSAHYHELNASSEVNRETRFNMLLTPDALQVKSLRAVTTKSQLLVQGVIDCFYKNKSGTYTVVDFKSDNVKSEQELIDRYADQLRIYQHAVYALTGVNATECYIYSFHFGKWISVQ